MSSNYRPFNFSAGPSVIPLAVLQKIEADLFSWEGRGLSVMEMSHRSEYFINIHDQLESDLRALLEIPKNFKIIFMQGGGTGANASVALNLSKGRDIDFLVSGYWSLQSKIEAKKYANNVYEVFSSESNGYTRIASANTWKINSSSSYLHICSNETAHGIQIPVIPDLKSLGSDIPLVVDISSDIASRAINWNLIGLAFAGAQKNLGIAGLTIVVVRDDLLDDVLDICPSIMNYKILSKNKSMYNTPPTWSIYVAGLVVKWLLEQKDGNVNGLAAIEKRTIKKSKALYSFIDGSEFYLNKIDADFRSKMNISFFLKDNNLNEDFLLMAEDYGLTNLAGHKAVGGMRASLYNAMPEEGVYALINYMIDFEAKYG